MSDPRSRFSIAWADGSASSRSPLRSSTILGGRPPAAAKAVSTHCMVFVHTATGRCQQRHCHVQQRPVADPSKTCLPQAHGERHLALASVTSRQLWWSVRESNPRLPDSPSGALPSELTARDIVMVRIHVRYTSIRTCEGESMRRWSRRRRNLASKRRRWESNPLGPGCSRLPCRLAPAS